MAPAIELWLETVLVPRGQKHLAVHQTFALDTQRVWVFGSDPQRAHIVLDCPCVDARHAELVRAEAEEMDGSAAWELVDYGGDNGTFLNGERVSRARVSWYVRGGALFFAANVQHSLLTVARLQPRQHLLWPREERAAWWQHPVSRGPRVLPRHHILKSQSPSEFGM